MNKSLVSALSATLSTALSLYIAYFLSNDKCLDSGGRVVGLFGCENAQGIIANLSLSGITIALIIIFSFVFPFLLVKLFEFVTNNEKET